MGSYTVYPLGSKSTDHLSRVRTQGNQKFDALRAKTAGTTNRVSYNNQAHIEKAYQSGVEAWQANEAKSKTVMFESQYTGENNEITTVYDLDGTNRSLPANYGSSTLQPLNPNNRNLVSNDPYTAYQAGGARGQNSKYSVIRDGKAGQAYRGANSAPGLKKPDRSRPLPKINSLVRSNDPDPLERHLRKPAGTSTYRNGQTGTSTKLHDPNQSRWSQVRGETKGQKDTPREENHKSENAAQETRPGDVNSPFRGERKRDRDASPPPKESIIKPPKTSRTIYFGPDVSNTSKVRQDRDNHIRRQMGLGNNAREKSMPRMQRKGTSFYKSRPDDMNTTVTFRSDREGTKSTILPRRERTRANVNRARSELMSRAKTKDDVRLRRTRNFVAVPVDTSHSKKEKIDRDIYKLEEQMNIYLQNHGINMNASEFDAASRMTGATMNTSYATSRAGSPKKKRQNPYTDPKRAVPPWHRKEYILNKREADMYQHVSKVYGNEKLRKMREDNFYRKVEALQLEQWHRLWDEYERKLREKDNARKRHLHQLKNVREKYTDDRWERIAKFPVNRIPIHDEDNRHDYGLPVDINEDPDAYVPRVGELHKPKETFDSDVQNTKNVKRWYPIFKGYRKVKYDQVKHPKMEGVDVVVLSDDEDAQTVGPDGKRPKKKRVKVTSLVKDAENALDGASDESEWEADVEDAEELNRRLRASTKTPADLNRTGNLNNSRRSNPYQRNTAPTSKFSTYGTRVDTKKPSNSTGSVYGQGKPGEGNRQSKVGPQKETQNAYKPQGNSRFRQTVGDFRSGVGSDRDQKGRPSDSNKKQSNSNKHDTNKDTTDDANNGGDISGINADNGKNAENGGDNATKTDNNASQGKNVQSPSSESVAKSVQNGDSKGSDSKSTKDGDGNDSDKTAKDKNGVDGHGKGKDSDSLNTQGKGGANGDSNNKKDSENKNGSTDKDGKKSGEIPNEVDNSQNGTNNDNTQNQASSDKNNHSADDKSIKGNKDGKDNIGKDTDKKRDNNLKDNKNEKDNKEGQPVDDKSETGNKDGKDNAKKESKDTSGKDGKDKKDGDEDGKDGKDKQDGSKHDKGKTGNLEDNKDGKDQGKGKGTVKEPSNKDSKDSEGDDSKDGKNATGKDKKSDDNDKDISDNKSSLKQTSNESIDKDKENQAPKKQVRIISPEKPVNKTTRPVSPGIGKNRGNYKVPKKFETEKSKKEATRPESPSLFNKGLYHEPKQFEVKKSDKAPTKAQGPDLGHGEYEAPKQYEITKTERTIRRVKSPFGDREPHKTRTPETHKRRTTRTEKDIEAVANNLPNRGGRRTVGHKADTDTKDDSRKANKRDQRHTDGDVINNSRGVNGLDGGKGGRKTKRETTETTTTTRRRRPGGYAGDDDADDDEDYGNKNTRQKPRPTRKASPKRKDSKSTKPKSTSVAQDPNRPDIPTPDLDTDDDDDDIFERAKRKYGIVLDDSD